ncbi:unnamed protein product [Darwinula stevensoni]|uniref:RFX-type winged-helix domain-containing protein n=1 Tax=Darwinula stevensoni TaxID=69355 RepID=A0A7R9A2N6_9CRUS|nr:unnamed protein product [Darwinula stevensoni]CAG0880314.1 unnamed protein product [Darwinula stevensoni]
MGRGMPRKLDLDVANLSEGEAAPGDATPYVQYVDSSTDPNSLYASTNGQMAYPVYTVADTIYNGGTTYYTNSTASGAAFQQGGAGNGGGVLGANTSAPTAYLIQTDPSAVINSTSARHSPQMDGVGVASYVVAASSDANAGGSDAGSGPLEADSQHSLAHATRVSPVTVQWLVENYETAEGVSLPRSTLYNHYLRHCAQHKLDPVNAASFGKLIRSVFLGLRTRRLGTRGNSKYHYYGIRLKPTSSLNHLGPGVSEGELRGDGGGKKGGSKGSVSEDEGGPSTHSAAATNPPTSSSASAPSASDTSPMGQSQHNQYLGDPSVALPPFPEIEFDPSDTLPGDLTLEDVEAFRALYEEHCESILNAVVKLQFSTVEGLWRSFWQGGDGDGGSNSGPQHNGNNSNSSFTEERPLNQDRILRLCELRPVLTFIQTADYNFYQGLVDLLIPEVLRPIPSTLTQAIRNFAKGLEGWLTSAMENAPPDVVHVKVCAVSAFAQMLRRYTSLNHLAQAARAVLHNSQQIQQMLADLNRVDFHHVQEQASWVCDCEEGLVDSIQEYFKATLQDQPDLEHWASWLNTVVERILGDVRPPRLPHAARQFLLKWSFYSSMVIRDLTLRSAASFGSFHLIRLLYDEYMFYLIENKIAQATGQTSIAVMGQFIGGGGSASGNESENRSNTEHEPGTSYASGINVPGTGAPVNHLNSTDLNHSSKRQRLM